MFRKNLFQTVAVLAIVLAYLSITGCKNHEHPAEHPSASGKDTSVTKDQLADAIEAYIEKEAVAHGGYFLAFDGKTDQELKLTLDKVHRTRLSKVGNDTYFACADFRTPEGKIYDLDVFMRGPDKDNLTFSEFIIHKEAGKERYTWYEQGGVWKKKPVDTVTEQPKEHPTEHPTEHPSEHPK